MIEVPQQDEQQDVRPIEKTVKVIPEKTHFLQGEYVVFRLVNMGEETVQYPSTAYGLSIKTEDGRDVLFALGGAMVTPFPSGANLSFSWYPRDPNTLELLPPGIYTIYSTSYSGEASAPIHIYIDENDPNQPTQGHAISSIAEKTTFRQDETVEVTFVNTGTKVLSFPYYPYGIKITTLDWKYVGLYDGAIKLKNSAGGIERYDHNKRGSLAPGDQISALWDLDNTPNRIIPPGMYRVSMDAANVLETVVITVLPADAAKDTDSN